MGIYYAKTWDKSTTEGGLWRGDIILGQPETDYRSWPAARDSRAAELSLALTWLQGRNRWPRLFVCRLHFFPPELIPNPSFQRKEKTDLSGQRLSLRSVLVAVCQPRIPPKAQTSSRQAGAFLKSFTKAGIRSHSLGGFQQSHVPSGSAPVFQPAQLWHAPW